MCRPAVTASLLVALAAGCAQPQAPPPAAPTEKPPLTIAVLSFGGSNEQASAAEDGCVMALLEGGYRVVERARVIAAVPDENDVDYGAVGRLLGADLIVDGGWTRGGGEGGARRLEARLISTHSAGVLGTSDTAARVRLTRAVGHKLCQSLVAQLP